MTANTDSSTTLRAKSTFDKKQIAIGAGLALTGVAAVVLVRRQVNVRLPEVDVNIDAKAAKK